MYISDVVLDKDNLGQINKRVNFATFYMVLFALNILAAIALIVYSIVTEVTDFYTYMFSAIAVLIAVFWIVYARKQQYMFQAAKIAINSNGSYTISNTTIQVDAQRKINYYTILNIVCFILVFACFIGAIVIQFITFNPALLYTIVMAFTLSTFLAYQTTICLIDDKMYRDVVFSTDQN